MYCKNCRKPFFACCGDESEYCEICFKEGDIDEKYNGRGD